MYSAEEQDDPVTNANRYVLADITSFFTLLVGIYFPSVTGRFSVLYLRTVCGPWQQTPMLERYSICFLVSSSLTLLITFDPPQELWPAPTVLETCVMLRSPSPLEPLQPSPPRPSSVSSPCGTTWKNTCTNICKICTKSIHLKVNCAFEPIDHQFRPWWIR